MLDVRHGVLRERAVLQVAGGVITAIDLDVAAADVPASAIDLSDYTVLPGLIDVHTHLADNSHMGPAFDHWTYPAATFGIVGTVNARTTLRAGFTTVRDVSAPFYADKALRDAIGAGWIEGPRMYISGPMLTMTGGHGTWGNWIAPQHQVKTDAHAQADGVDEVRKAVRTLVRNRVDLIKVAATGGFGTAASIPGAASYSVEELKTIVEEARKHGLKVAAHAHGAAGIVNAVEAGIHSIEHGTMMDDAALAAVKKARTWVVMDLLAAHFDLIERNADFSDKQLTGSNAEEYERYASVFRRAYEGGVRLAFGTDAGIYPHGRNAEQFSLMVQAGMAPDDALRSATIWAAELLEASDEFGELKAGLSADLIAVAGNPLTDISTLESVRFVMKQGKVVVNVSGASEAQDH
ncbi:MAG: amidohydrolase family protein [Pseudomonadota bacterium]